MSVRDALPAGGMGGGFAAARTLAAEVIDKQTLLDAQAHPEDYKDLIVRVAGYSDHFHNLSRELQDEIIERTEQTIG